MGEMGQVRIAADTVSYSAAISACEKGANPLTALALFMRMDQCSIPKDQIVFNSTISACDKGMSWTMALQLLGQMQGARLKADACSYSAAITASGKASHWSTALKLLKEAKECGGHVSNMIVSTRRLARVRRVVSGRSRCTCWLSTERGTPS